ncbi:MAG: hypothetical protein AVDCRST_MAG64-1942, partial [uncultured Phycisphaerae bacterium]
DARVGRARVPARGGQADRVRLGVPVRVGRPADRLVVGHARPDGERVVHVRAPADGRRGGRPGGPRRAGVGRGRVARGQGPAGAGERDAAAAAAVLAEAQPGRAGVEVPAGPVPEPAGVPGLRPRVRRGGRGVEPAGRRPAQEPVRDRLGHAREL